MTRYGIDPIDEAIYDTAHGFVDPNTGVKGVSALARKTGRNATTLSKKVDPFVETHLINIVELRSIMSETKNYSIIRTLATEFGYGVYLLPKSTDTDKEKAILDYVLSAAAEGGEACQAINKAIQDGEITEKESIECSKEINDQIEALIGLRERIIDASTEPKDLVRVEEANRFISGDKKSNFSTIK